MKLAAVEDVNLEVELERRVRRIEIHQVAGRSDARDPVERVDTDMDERPAQRPGRGTKPVFLADLRVCVTPRRNIEVAASVQPEQAVVARAIQVDEHGREVRRIRLLHAGSRELAASRIEDPITNPVVRGGAAPAVRRRQGTEFANDTLDVPGNRRVAADQISIRVSQAARPAVELPGIDEVEEDGSASQEWLVVGMKNAGDETAQLGEKLTFPACPLQEGSNLGGRAGHG